MNYLYAYLAVGIAMLAFALIQNYLQERDSTAIDYSLNERKGQTPLRKFLEHVVVPGIAGLLFVIAWPIAAVFLTKMTIKEHRSKKARKAAEFSISKDDLLEMLSVDEIEQHEAVSDPLEAVPALPFGHLNASWVEFRDEAASQGEIWSFKTIWSPEFEGPVQVFGYVCVQNGKPGAHFVTLKRALEDDGKTQ